MKKDLWLRLNAYHFDGIVPAQMADRVAALFGGSDASTKAFASKLSRKLGWTPGFALRAIAEYKRFVFLGNLGSLNVTPSRVIDQVWHEHLLFSRAYREFCGAVLGRDFDHNPELIPANDQTDVFQSQYLETLDAYRTEFNAEPPADIWSVPKFKTSAAVDSRAVKQPKRSRPDRWADDTPLHVYFGESGGSGDDSSHAGFGGGGEFSGGGASREWGGDSSSHDHGDSGGSSDSGDGGGSGCSSSCGGGGD